MTKSLQQNELGMLTLGTNSDPMSIVVPPGQANFTIKNFCFKDCTTTVILNYIINNNPVFECFLNNFLGLISNPKIIRIRKNIGSMPIGF